MSFNLSEKNLRMKREAQAKIIEKMLEDGYGDYASIISEETTEANLDKARTDVDPSGTLETELGDSQTGPASEVTEARLDGEKSLFSDHRKNVSGDIPKLEEKRLSESPVEQEKYEKAND